MVIRLLGLLSEDEKLRAALMRFPDKLIEFLALTLNRGSLLCQSRVEPDDDCGGLEVQSLATALSLMSYLVSHFSASYIKLEIRYVTVYVNFDAARIEHLST